METFQITPWPDGEKILIAEDDAPARTLITQVLTRWGFSVQAVADGQEAFAALTVGDAPKLALLDWQMPQLDGLEVCKRLRAHASAEPVYIVMLTARGGCNNIVAGLRAGANDYVVKPFDLDELSARLTAGVTILRLQRSLSQRVRQLEGMLAQVRQLEGLIPICAWCKKIRADENYWQQVEEYLCEHTSARFSHGICPDCLKQATDEAERFAKPF